MVSLRSHVVCGVFTIVCILVGRCVILGLRDAKTRYTPLQVKRSAANDRREVLGVNNRRGVPGVRPSRTTMRKGSVGTNMNTVPEARKAIADKPAPHCKPHQPVVHTGSVGRCVFIDTDGSRGCTTKDGKRVLANFDNPILGHGGQK
eukprot:2168747-Amphidinium_carterae.1